MKITWGHTRIVFLYREFAIKIPKVRLLCAFKSLWRYICYSELPRSIANERYRNNPLLFTLVFLFMGISANRREFFHAQGRSFSKGEFVAPVQRLFAFGLIEVQKRGWDILVSYSLWNKLVKAFQENGISNVDMYNPDNFSIIDGVICIHDCGSRETVTVLEAGGYEVLREVNLLADEVQIVSVSRQYNFVAETVR